MDHNSIIAYKHIFLGACNCTIVCPRQQSHPNAHMVRAWLKRKTGFEIKWEVKVATLLSYLAIHWFYAQVHWNGTVHWVLVYYLNNKQIYIRIVAIKRKLPHKSQFMCDTAVSYHFGYFPNPMSTKNAYIVEFFLFYVSHIDAIGQLFICFNTFITLVFGFFSPVLCSSDKPFHFVLFHRSTSHRIDLCIVYCANAEFEWLTWPRQWIAAWTSALADIVIRKILSGREKKTATAKWAIDSNNLCFYYQNVSDCANL